ncbi:LD-carboxypeptidase [Candidatus Margulisiibacteriota bacterium]
MKKLIKPQHLERGDTIGIVAPASSFDKDNFKSGLKFLRKIGYRVRYEHAIFNKCWSEPGHNKQRAAQINRMFLDPEVKAILCAKGGYGSTEIIPYLDHEIIRNNPKIFVGYSDITILLLYLQKIANMVVFHGPVVSDEIYEGMNAVTIDYLLRAVSQTTPLGHIMFPQLISFKPGKASGTLVGGNISLIIEAFDTPYDLDTKNTILFLEDVDESIDVLRDYFQQLQQKGKFENIKGLLLGEMTGCFEEREHLRELVTAIFKNHDIPILFGFPSGHTKKRGEPHITLPLGVGVTIDADNSLLVIKESGVN